MDVIIKILVHINDNNDDNQHNDANPNNYNIQNNIHHMKKEKKVNSLIINDRYTSWV